MFKFNISVYIPITILLINIFLFVGIFINFCYTFFIRFLTFFLKNNFLGFNNMI